MKQRIFIFVILVIFVNSYIESQTIAGEAEFIVDINKPIGAVVFELTPRKVQKFLDIDLNSDNILDLQFKVIVDLESANNKSGAYLKIKNPFIKVCDYSFLPIPNNFSKGDTIFNDCDSLSNQSIVFSEYSVAKGRYPLTKEKRDTTFLGFNWIIGDTIYEGWIKYGYSVGSRADFKLHSIGCNCDLNIVTSITTPIIEVDEENIGLKIFPNPISDGILRVLLNDNSDGNKYHLEIVDMLGQVLYKNKNFHVDRPEEISVNGFNQGMYYLILKNKSKVISKRIIIN